MNQNLNRFKNFLATSNFQLRNFIKYSWPINWSNFKKPEILFKSLFQSPYLLRVIFITSVVGVLVSLSFFTFGLYLSLTVEVAAQGGVFNEVVLNSKVQRLNPVLNESSEAEKKINSLLYLPLYNVKFPDYLTESEKEPSIEPVLLEKVPEWINTTGKPEDNFKILRFTLKTGLKWSDGSNITLDDIDYSFKRLKEEGGNSDFRNVFENYELIKVPGSTNEFQIQPINANIGANPQLIYLANFKPISVKFYKGVVNSDLSTSIGTLQPEVTSGYFTVPKKVVDPDNQNGPEVNNPISKNIQDYSTIVLLRNPVSNTNNRIYVDKYVFRLTDNINEQGGSGQDSLERYAKANKADLFSRFLGPSGTTSSSQIKSLTGLEQTTFPTNTYFNLFLNIQSTTTNLDGYFINQTLRKYLICKTIDFQLDKNNGLSNVEQIPADKRLVPLQLNESFNPDCKEVENELTSLTNNTSKSKIYSIDSDERTGIKRVKAFGKEIPLTLLGLNEFRGYGEQVQEKLKGIGLPVDAVWVNSDQIEAKIKEKSYHILLLPVTLVSRNPYPIFGSGGRNVSNIIRNERVEGRKIDELLKTYGESGGTNKEAKTQLVNFFETQFVSLNLFRGKQEVNYSSRVANLGKDFPSIFSFPIDIYGPVGNWSVEKKRKAIWG